MREDRKSLSRITECAVFACVALIIFAVEACVPIPVAIPGVKLGLANVVTLAAVYIIGKRETLMILIVRIILGNIFTGQAVSLIYSLTGGIFCYIITVALKSFFKGKNIWALGTIGAIFHNFGQLLCAYLMLGSGSLVYYGLVLTAAACVTGTFTGLCAQYVILHNQKYLKGNKKYDY